MKIKKQRQTEADVMDYQRVKKLPKVELHCHLDGSIRPDTLRKIAETQGISLPENDEQFLELLIAPEQTKNLAEYLERFSIVLTCLQTEEALRTAALDVISQAAAESISYIEIRFAPSLHTKQGLSLPQVVTAVLEGLQQGQDLYGVQSNALLCGMRHEELTAIEKIVHLADQFKASGVVGFDLAGNEADFPPYAFEEVLALVSKLTIPLTLHAGECGCGKNVIDAVQLGATRIGHGIALKETPEFIDQMKERNVLLELCPTSNFQTKTVTSVEDYPFRLFQAAGINLCINTDNRTVSNTTLTDEFMKLHNWYGLTYQEMEQLTHQAIDGAFLSAKQKESLHQQISHQYTED